MRRDANRIVWIQLFSVLICFFLQSVHELLQEAHVLAAGPLGLESNDSGSLEHRTWPGFAVPTAAVGDVRHEGPVEVPLGLRPSLPEKSRISYNPFPERWSRLGGYWREQLRASLAASELFFPSRL